MDELTTSEKQATDGRDKTQIIFLLQKKEEKQASKLFSNDENSLKFHAIVFMTHQQIIQ